MKETRKKQRKFDNDFKVNAAKLVLEQGLTRSQVAKDLGVSPNQIGNWVKNYELSGADAFPGKGRLTAQEQKLKDMEQEIKKLKMERDILKKATAFFANHGW